MWQQCETEVPVRSDVAEEESTGKKKKAGKPKDGQEKQVKGIKRYGPFKPLPSTIDVTLDRGGVDGKAAIASYGGEGSASCRPVPIDVNDTAFRTSHWQKWQRVAGKDYADADEMRAGPPVPELSCGICKEAVDAQVGDYDTAQTVELTSLHPLEPHNLRALPFGSPYRRMSRDIPFTLPRLLFPSRHFIPITSPTPATTQKWYLSILLNAPRMGRSHSRMLCPS